MGLACPALIEEGVPSLTETSYTMAVDIRGRPALFSSEIEEEWMGRGQTGRKKGGRVN